MCFPESLDIVVWKYFVKRSQEKITNHNKRKCGDTDVVGAAHGLTQSFDYLKKSLTVLTEESEPLKKEALKAKVVIITGNISGNNPRFVFSPQLVRRNEDLNTPCSRAQNSSYKIEF